MVFARDRDVSHSGFLHERNPFVSVELRRIELRGESLVLVYCYPLVVHHPLPTLEKAVDTPVNKQPKLGILKPLASFKIFGRGLVVGLGVCDDRRSQRQRNRGYGDLEFFLVLRHGGEDIVEPAFGQGRGAEAGGAGGDDRMQSAEQ